MQTCLGMCIDMCTDMCVEMCTGIILDMCMDMCVEMCADICLDMCMDMCAEMCAGICLDMCMDMYMDMCSSSEGADERVEVRFAAHVVRHFVGRHRHVTWYSVPAWRACREGWPGLGIGQARLRARKRA